MLGRVSEQMQLFFVFINCLGRLQEVLEPLNRVFGVSLQLVIVIHKVKAKSRSVSGCPLPIIQQRPREVPFHVASVFSDSVLSRMLGREQHRKSSVSTEKTKESARN